MQIKIVGRHFTVTPAIKKMINEGVAKFTKFLHNIIEVHFILKVEKYRQIVEIILFAKNIVLKCKEETSDIHLSIEKALHNMERQLRQHKEKVKAHHIAEDREQKTEDRK